MTPEQIKADYRRSMDAVGEIVTIRRYTGNGPNRPRFDADVRARVVDYEPDELVGPIVQGDRKLIVLAEDLIAAQVPLDLRKGDKVVVRGRELNIEAPDDNTRRVAGVLIAYELQVRG
ncbi:hypothetical protein [Mesorhizobium sp. CAU 1741]|uniref:hypothetical protein n=1 Tax=Mesorhizobium sp. CAU 1741 TaxID=3140366 RepID=UPI00325AEB76